MGLALRVVSHSEIGLVRKNNQDSGYTSPHLLVVADGMGGAAAGDLASAVAVDTLMHVDESATGPAMLDVMSGAIDEANDRLADLIAEDVSLDGMGTTVTAALFDGTGLGMVHIGDSRAYLLRAGLLRRLTHDHSWVQSLVDEGRITEAEAAVHPHRSLLLRVLNGQPGADAEASLLELAAGDRLMFCSDGLCGLVDDVEIAELLALPDRDEALAALVAAARREGGVDNITVLVADVVETATGLAGAPADAAETPSYASSSVVLGAAAERSVPPTGEQHEDTVITRRPVPAGDPTSPVSRGGSSPLGAADESRYDPLPPARRRFVRPLVTVALVLVVVAAGLGAAYAWTRSQYYVGTAGAQVAIYRGVSESLPLVPLSHLFEVQDLEVAALPVYYQERVRSSIDVTSLAAARETVTELRDAVTRCGRTTGASPTPSASPSRTTTPRPRSTAAPTRAPTTVPTVASGASSAAASPSPGPAC